MRRKYGRSILRKLFHWSQRRLDKEKTTSFNKWWKHWHANEIIRCQKRISQRHPLFMLFSFWGSMEIQRIWNIWNDTKSAISRDLPHIFCFDVRLSVSRQKIYNNEIEREEKLSVFWPKTVKVRIKNGVRYVIPQIAHRQDTHDAAVGFLWFRFALFLQKPNGIRPCKSLFM